MQKPGKVIKSIKTRKGREIVLRAPDYGDFHELYEFINSLVEEGVYILLDEKVTPTEEMDYVYGLVKGINLGMKLHILAEYDGKIVGACGIDRQKGRSSHVGRLGIAVKNGFRCEGIGSALMETILELAREAGLKIITLHVIAENTTARRFYNKFGFKKAGLIEKGSKYRGKYADDILMTMLF